MASTGFGVREDAAAFARGPEAWPKRWSAADAIRLGALGFFAEGERVELVDGSFEVMPADGDLHVHDLGVLAAWFHEQRVRAPHITGPIAVHVKATLRLGEMSLREPDLMITRPVPRTRLPEPSDVLLLVEVSVSSGKRDREDKRLAYAAVGVPEYWVWDAEARELVVFRGPAPGGYRDMLALTGGAATPMFAPELAFRLALLQEG